MKKTIAILTLLLSFGSLLSQTGTIKLELTGINPDGGNEIKIAVYDENGFLKETKFSKNINTEGNTAYVEMTNIEEGKYAIALFQDENSDGKMNTNFIGIPVERGGFSNNAIGNFGPPNFEDASFNVFAGQSTTLNIELH